jgi:hypothetical protein
MTAERPTREERRRLILEAAGRELTRADQDGEHERVERDLAAAAREVCERLGHPVVDVTDHELALGVQRLLDAVSRAAG